jgi:hypothetical protein
MLARRVAPPEPRANWRSAQHALRDFSSLQHDRIHPQIPTTWLGAGFRRVVIGQVVNP